MNSKQTIIKPKISDIVVERSIVEYPYMGVKVECMVRQKKNGKVTLLPCRAIERITPQKGMCREITFSTLNRLAKFLYHSHLQYER